MKFLLLAYTNTQTWTEQDISAEEIQRLCLEVDRIHQELTASGELLGTEGLADTSHSVSVRPGPAGSSPLVTDGPFIDTKETMVSYMLIDVESKERAVEIATRMTALGSGDSCEVRPVMDVSFDDLH